jgi:ABC-type multidrug transport system fused ATPase/permease subunit
VHPQPTWLRQQVALVSQEPLMFDASIRANLSYGMRVPPSLRALEAAAEAAQVCSPVWLGRGGRTGLFACVAR